ncbi:MAG: metallophosphoesterase, partial [Clostridia bacterium]|nr:metallophosphoesterase [Clostridia bacterium]
RDSQWDNHSERIRESWLQLVGDGDTVLIPGDISWAINLEEAQADFAFIESLPGKKILSKGNHDYWWSTLKKCQSLFSSLHYHSLNILHNNAFRIGEYCVCGSRGWSSPDEPDFSEEDQKIFNRELERLKLSLREGKKLGGELIAMLHYPPFDTRHRPNAFGSLLEEFGVKTCIYGHIHGKANASWLNENIQGIGYRLVSCDLISFKPVLLFP